MLVCSCGAAQVGGTSVRTIGVTDRHAEFFLRGDIREETEEQTGGGETDESDHFFEEGVDYNLRGYVYHPNLVDWDARLRLGLSQQRIEINDEEFDTDGDLLGYAVSALLLRQKPVSVRLVASDSTEFLERSFARRNEFEITRQAVEIISRVRLPMNLLVERVQSLEVSDLRETDRDTRRVRLRATHRPDPDSYTTMTYEWEDTDEVSVFTPPAGVPIVQDLPVRRNELNLVNRWVVGTENHPHRLSGRFRWLDRSGFFPNEILTFDQRLDLVHSDRLSSFYQFIYDRNQTDTEDDRLLFGEVGVLRKIYGSLELGGRLNVRDRTFENGTDDSVGAFLDARYHKLTALGPYDSTLLFGREWEEETSSGGTRPVTDEAVTLEGIAFSPLAERGVVPGSLRVTNADRTIEFVRGIDFQLRTIGATTEIARLVGGDIPDGATVLVSYRTASGRFTEFTTTHVNWNNRLALRGTPLFLYYDYRLRDEQLTDGDDPGNLDTDESNLFGLELRYRGVTAAAEHERREERLSPDSVANRLRARYQRPLSQDLDLAVGARIERIEFENVEAFGLPQEDESLETFSTFGRLTTRLRRNLLLLVEADYFRTTGQENDTLVRLGVGLEGRYRNLDFAITARHHIFEQESTEGTRELLSFDIVRRF